MKRRMIAILAAALLCSCADTKTNQAITETRNLPANYGAIALAAVKSQLKDPDSLKTLRLSEEPPTSGNGKTGVFVDVNAKNSFGGYTGVQHVLVVFKNGEIVDIVQ